MKAKRIVSLLLATLMLVCVMPISASAFSIKDVAAIVDATENAIKTIDKLSAKELGATDLIKTTAEQLASKKAVDAIAEVLDNGTDIFVDGADLDAVAEKLDAQLPEVEDSGIVVGGYVSASDNGYAISPIFAGLVDEDANDPVIKNAFAKIKADDFLDYEDLIADLRNNAASIKSLAKNISDLAQLQADVVTTPMGPSFHYYGDGSATKYWLKAGAENGSNWNYKWHDECTYKDGNGVTWTYIASVMVSPFIVKHKTTSGYNYDFAYCNYSVSPNGDSDHEKAVDTYQVSMKAGSNTSFSNWTRGDGDNPEVEWEDHVAAESFTVVSDPIYTWNSSSQEVYMNSATSTKLAWYSDPGRAGLINDMVYDKAFSLSPSAEVKSKVGNKATVTFGFDEIKLYGGVRWYTMAEDFAVSLSFKNHAAA